MSPEPEKVREIAYPGRSGDAWRDSDGFEWILTPGGRMRMLSRYVDLIAPAELVTKYGPVTPIDTAGEARVEQPQDEGDDTAAGRLRAVVRSVDENGWRDTGYPDESDIDEVLDERDALAARVAELEFAQADHDAGVRAVASVFRWLDIERDKGTLRIGAGTSAALALLQEKFAGPIAELHVRENGGTA